jgi:hypothetical protein
MNLTPLEHTAYAVTTQTLIGLLSGNWWAGAAFGAALFIGREITQAEYRWIATYGDGLRANLPWWGSFDRRVWTHLDSWLDWLVPTVVVVGVATLAQVYFFKS